MFHGGLGNPLHHEDSLDAESAMQRDKICEGKNDGDLRLLLESKVSKGYGLGVSKNAKVISLSQPTPHSMLSLSKQPWNNN